jgi:multidrug efflux pump subunit AcrB
MIRFFAGHPTAANLLMLLMLAAGLISLGGLRRETFPDFSTDTVRVTVPYPGASAREVEDAVCQRIEDAAEDLVDVDEIRCESRESIATADLDMVEDGDIGRFINDVRTEIEAIDDFPDLAEQPVVRELNRTEPVIAIAVTGPMSEPHLRVYAEQLRERLIRLPEISQVDLQGFSQRQIRIGLDALALRQYGLSVDDVARIVERQSVDLPAGTVETGERDLLVRFDDERRTVREFEDLVVIGGEAGAELRLGQIATVTDLFEQEEERVVFDGERAALLDVRKTKDQDTLSALAAVQAFVAEERARAPPEVRLTLTRDVASIVEDRLTMLLNNGWQGLVLVFLVMWLFFSLKTSFWVAMGLPVSFLGTMGAMVALGYSIDMLTMVALLIAIGLIMDDAIVIAENIAKQMERGEEPLGAAVAGTREVALGVLSSFATSVCVFAPLAFLEGDIGKVLRVVPVVLILTLAISLIEAFLILPHHMLHAMKHRERSRFHQAFDARFARVRERGLGRIVDWAVRWRYLTLGLVLMAFLVSISMLAGGVLKVRAFPDLDGDVIEARILLPQGTPLQRTEQVVDRVSEALDRVDAEYTPRQPDEQPLVRNVLVQYASNPDAFESGPHVATVTVDLLGAEIRNAEVDAVLDRWREEVGTVPDVLALTYAEPNIGPAGIPIAIRLQGEDLDELKAASRALVGWLDSYEGVVDLTDDLRPGKPELRLRLREGAFALGLDAATIANQLRAAYQGRTALEIQVGPEDFEIDVRLSDADRNSLGDLDEFTVTRPNGEQVPLSAVAAIETGRGFARIARIDGRRTVTVRGDLNREVANLNEILADTQERFLPDLRQRFPGVEVELEGEAAEQAETQASLVRGLGLGLLGMFILLSFQFRSYVEPVIVLIAIPLALIGVVWGHLGMGLELVMPSLLGLASLAGVVVNDSILLVTFVKINVARGLPVVDAARQASRDRFRPVLLTSLTTIAGVLPLLFEQSLQAQVLVPLVNALAFGLASATVLVLVLMPALYAILHDFGLTSVSREGRETAGAPQPAE